MNYYTDNEIADRIVAKLYGQEDRTPTMMRKIVEKLDGIFLPYGMAKLQAFQLGSQFEADALGSKALTMMYRDHDIIIPGDKDSISYKLSKMEPLAL